MWNITIKNGLIAGVLMTLVFFFSYMFSGNDPESFALQEVVGYAGIILGFSMIFVGVKQYRDYVNNGSISFGKALKIGLMISVIAGIMIGIYTAIYIKFINPEFTEIYFNHYMETLKNSGQSPEIIQAGIEEMESFRGLMNSGFFQGGLMGVTVFLVGLVMSLIAGFVLRRK